MPSHVEPHIDFPTVEGLHATRRCRRMYLQKIGADREDTDEEGSCH